MATRTLKLFYEIIARDQTKQGASSAASNAKKVKTQWEQLRDSTRRGLETGQRLQKFGSDLSGLGKRVRDSTFDFATSSANLSKAQAEVATLGALTREEIEKITRAQTEQFGQGFDGNLKQTALLYNAVSAGATNAADATALVTDANRLAIGGVADTDAAILALTKATANFGKQGVDTARAADVFFGTVRDGQITIDEIARAFPQVAGVASNAGLVFEETNAALAVLSKTQGSATQGANAFKAGLSNIIKPTKDAKDEARRARRVFRDFGFDKATLEAKGLVGFVQQLDEANAALVARGRKGLDLAKLFGSVEALNAFSSLVGQVELLDQTTQNAVDSAGQASKAFNTIADEDAFKLARTQAQAGQLRADIGDELIPIIAELGAQLRPIAQDVRQWVQDNPDLVRQLGKFVIGFGALATVLGPLVITIGGLTSAFTLLRAATSLTDAAAKALVRTRKSEQVETGKAAAGASKNIGGLAGKLGLFAGIALEVIGIVNSAIEIAKAARGIQEQRTRQGETIAETQALAGQAQGIARGLSDQELQALVKATEGSQIGVQEQRVSGSLLNSLSFGVLGEAGRTEQVIENLDRAAAVQEVARREAAGTLTVDIRIDSRERAEVTGLEQAGLLPVDVNPNVDPTF